MPQSETSAGETSPPTTSAATADPSTSDQADSANGGTTMGPPDETSGGGSGGSSTGGEGASDGSGSGTVGATGDVDTDGSSSDEGSSTGSCTPLADGAAIGQDCGPGGMMCPPEYTCQPFAGVVLEESCQIFCTQDCECPMGTTCTETTDKTMIPWFQCS